MTPPDDQTRLQHMLRHAEEALQFSSGRQRVDLDTDRLLNLALVRLLEIIGEAATRVSSSVQAAHAGIPWPQIIGLRNRLIHGYDAVDLDILWNILQIDLPPLVSDLRAIVSGFARGNP
ncbi:MAG: HepT-like ribonuclease domain-containing protein [Gemmataceae bacterium]